LAVGTNDAKKVFINRKTDSDGRVWTPLLSLPQAGKVAAVKFARAGELLVSADILGAIHVFDATAEYTPLRSISVGCRATFNIIQTITLPLCRVFSCVAGWRFLATAPWLPPWGHRTMRWRWMLLGRRSAKK
jgi:hypothetical protein